MTVEELEVEIEWASADDFTRFTREIVAPISALLEQHPQKVRDEAWAAVAEAAKPYAEADGTVRLSNLALVAAGTA